MRGGEVLARVTMMRIVTIPRPLPVISMLIFVYLNVADV